MKLGSLKKPTPEPKLKKEKTILVIKELIEKTKKIKLSNFEKGAIKKFKGSSYSINDNLRRDKKYKSNTINTLKKITSSFKTKRKLIFWRGPGSYIFNENLKKGGIIKCSDFVSTSIDKEIAMDFTSAYHYHDYGNYNSKKVLLKILAPKGTMGFYFDIVNNSHSHEKEYVLHPNTKFKVLGHTEDSNYHYINLKIVNQKK